MNSVLRTLYNELQTLESSNRAELTIHIIDPWDKYYTIPASRLHTLPVGSTIIPIVIDPCYWQACIRVIPDIPMHLLNKTLNEVQKINQKVLDF